MMFCSVPSCGSAHYGLGLCHKHYVRKRRTGSEFAVRKHANGSGHIWLHRIALVSDTDECVIWPFSSNNNGYGTFAVGHKKWLAHRYVCFQSHGKPESECLEAAHSCGVRKCCNPRHVRWATAAENEQDKLDHGTTTRGERHGQSRLTEDQVLEIRNASGSQRQIADAKRTACPI